jgi:hypothetical protein
MMLCRPDVLPRMLVHDGSQTTASYTKFRRHCRPHECLHSLPHRRRPKGSAARGRCRTPPSGCSQALPRCRAAAQGGPTPQPRRDSNQQGSASIAVGMCASPLLTRRAPSRRTPGQPARAGGGRPRLRQGGTKARRAHRRRPARSGVRVDPPPPPLATRHLPPAACRRA